MQAPAPNPHPVGTPAWAEHEDAWFREFNRSGELHRLMATIGVAKAQISQAHE